jgi:hypothetical protein
VVFRGVLADIGIRTGAQAARKFAADVEFDVGVAHQQRLRIGIDRDELNALKADLDHSVHGVDAATTDADDLDDREIVVRMRHRALPSLRRWRLPEQDRGQPFYAGRSRVPAKPSTLS